jgi:dihydrofolate synthase/folylpolyglutamate synthase
MKGKKVLLFSAMRDKDYGEVLRVLAPHFEKVVLCEVSLARSAGLSELFSAARRLGRDIVLVKNPEEALLRAKELAGRNGTVVAAGSIYLLAELFGSDKIRIAQ